MFARSTTINGDSGAIDAGIAYVRDQVMPMLSEMPGLRGAVDDGRPRVRPRDRHDLLGVAATRWTPRRPMSRDARAKAAEIMGGTPVVDEWEIAMMHREHEARDGFVLPGHLGADGPRRPSTR